MKVSCGVIRDLLPLYAEKMTGEESDALISEHLAGCRDCSEYLAKLEKPIENDTESASSSDENALRLIRRGIRNRKLAAVLFSVFLVFTVMLTAFSRIVRPEYISYNESKITVSESANGDVYASFSDRVTSCKLKRTVNEENRSIVEIKAWTSLWDKIIGKASPSVLISSADKKADIVYYEDLSTEESNVTDIYGTAEEEDAVVLPRLMLGYYFIGALVAAVLLGIACLACRKCKKAARICGYLFAAPVSYLLGHLIITTGFVSFTATYDFVLNCIAALAIYGVLISGAVLLSQYRQDTVAVQKN